MKNNDTQSAKQSKGTDREPDETKPVIVPLAHVKPDPERQRAVEGAYRRGVAQTLSLAGDLVRDGATADDLDELTNLSMRWRHDRKPNQTYLDDLVQAWRQGARGVTGIDLRPLMET